MRCNLAYTMKKPTPDVSDELVDNIACYCKLLADPTRLKIMLLLGFHGDFHVSGLCQQLQLNQPAVSHHLSILKDAGVIELKREGKHNYYAFICEPFCDLIKSMIRAISCGENAIKHDGLLVELSEH